MPISVMPPKKAGVSGRPSASTTVAAAGAASAVPTACTTPLRTSTSAFFNVPCVPAVCTVALRIRTSWASALIEVDASATATANALTVVPANAGTHLAFVLSAALVIESESKVDPSIRWDDGKDTSCARLMALPPAPA